MEKIASIPAGIKNPALLATGSRDMIRKIAFEIVLILLLSPLSGYCYQKTTSLTDSEIIERLTRLEEGQKALREQMTAGLANLQVQINGLRDLILGGFAVMFAGIFALIGFVIWDRRTALSPVMSKTKELEEMEDLTLRVLKEYARKKPKVAKALRTLGML